MSLSTHRSEQDQERPPHLLALHAASHRSQEQLLLLQATSEGRLTLLLDNAGLPQFTSSRDIFHDCYASCRSEETTPASVKVRALRAFYSEAGALGWLAEPSKLPAIQDLPGPSDALHDNNMMFCRPYSPAALAAEADNNLMALSAQTDVPRAAVGHDDDALEGQEALEDFLEVHAGYALGDDLPSSQDVTAQLEDDMFEEAVDAANAATIKAAALVKSRAEGPSNADLRRIEEASAVLAGTLGKPPGLTAAELEEEALLLLARQQNAQTAAARQQQGPGEDAMEGSKLSRTSADKGFVDYSDILRGFEIEQSDDEDSDEDEAALVPVQAAAAAAAPSAASEQPRHRPATLKKAHSTWQAAISQTLLAILDARRRCQHPIGYQDEISVLVRVPVTEGTAAGAAAAGVAAAHGDVDPQLRCFELLYVKWVNAAEREGRTARVDGNHRVVWSPATLFGRVVPTEVFDLARFNYMIHAAGASSKRIRGSGSGVLRDTLPDPVVRFVNFLKVGIMHANEDDS